MKPFGEQTQAKDLRVVKKTVIPLTLQFALAKPRHIHMIKDLLMSTLQG